MKKADGQAKKGDSLNATAKYPSQKADNLRARAERLADKTAITDPGSGLDSSLAEHKKLLHELLVHQFELELQNEELRQARQQLEAEQARYFELYDLAPVGYMIVSPDGFIEEANLTAAALLAVDKGKLLDSRLSDFIAASDQDIFYLQCQSLLETGLPQEREFRVRKPDSTVFWIQVTGTLGPGQGGLPVYRLVINDITVRKLAEQALQRSEMQLRFAMKSGRIVGWMLDVASSELSFSDNFDEVFGFSHREIPRNYRSALTRLLLPEDLGGFMSDLEQAKACQSDIHTTWRFVNPASGSTGWIEFHGMTMNTADSEYRRMVGILMNITERKQAEQWKKENERQTLNLLEKLRQTDRNKNHFISVLSHELRNPLATIVMGHALLKHIPPDSEKAKKTQAMQERQTMILTRMVEDLLDVTRISEDKIKLKLERLDLAELVRQTASDICQSYDEKGISLHVDLAPESICVNGDRVRLAQSIGNLLHNALKFSPPESIVTITVTLDADRREAIVRVRDQGAGLEPEALEHIFQPFTQVDQALARTQGGLGLGLSIVRGMVELHGGHVEAESEGVGKGSTFTICLPLQ